MDRKTHDGTEEDGMVWLSLNRKELLTISQELLTTLNTRINANYNDTPEQFQQSFSIALTITLFQAARILSLNPDFAIQNAQLFSQQLENELRQSVTATTSTTAH